mmetsp:Transcript_95521/g.169617  ORF Transcript_95521/g.169617 Transcript_95521/m.169617 type:complete len:396 (+) Transcript_95521:92-1279(+)
MTDRTRDRDRDRRRDKSSRRREKHRRDFSSKETAHYEAAAREKEKESSGSWAFFLGERLRGWCVEVAICPKDSTINASETARDQRRRERAERREARRKRREGRKAARPVEAGAEQANPRSSAGGEAERKQQKAHADSDDSGGSARSGVSSASYASSYLSQSSRADSERSQKESKTAFGGGGSARNLRTPESNKAASATGERVQVLNLADLQGQDLEKLQSKGNKKAKDDDPPLSARSGRSEGAQSHRSEGAQSVKSVASTSIGNYMDHLSEPMSKAECKKLVKDFVRQMVKGREMGVLRADGVLKPVKCGLTRSLDVFKIKSGSETRLLDLKEVARVVHGSPDDLSDLETPLDEHCSTLELESAECISFKFAERKAAELFTMCMQVFIDGLKKKK